MPKEHRKRGKKHKAPVRDVVEQPKLEPENPIDNDSQRVPVGDSEAPFGYVDSDVKAYFKTIDLRIQSWQEEQDTSSDAEGGLNEEKRLFLIAALQEMSGKEKQLATDAECSGVLERVAYSMDDFMRRVFLDRFSGSYETLLKHRFASHVCQTLFSISADTVSRETKGVLPSLPRPGPDQSDDGELRTLTKLVLDICEELLPSFTSLVMDPFASHVLRALLFLLYPTLQASHSSGHKVQALLRSKRSSAWNARRGPLTSLFVDGKKETRTGDALPQSVPIEFREAARMFIEVVKEELSDNEVRAWAASKVASPVLQILLDIEADQKLVELPRSLMDRVLVGIITSYHNDPNAVPEPSDYLSSLLRDPTSSHLLETLVTRSPEPAFVILWATYFKGKLGRLANHPVANFVLARALSRATAEQVKETCVELYDVLPKILRNSRTGVLRSLIERVTVLGSCEQEVVNAVCAAFGVIKGEDRSLLVPCILRLKSLMEYQGIKTGDSDADAKDDDAEPFSKLGEQRSPRDAKRKQPGPGSDIQIQGALLLQSFLRLPEPHNQLIIDSIQTLSISEVLAIAHDPTSSRVLDALFESPTVPFRAKRAFVMSLIGHYHELVDNQIGSFIGDRCWAFADPYLREKIGRSLFSQEQFLAGSRYGKYFARNLNLYLLQRRPAEWKELQAKQKKLLSLPKPDASASRSASKLTTEEATTATPKGFKKRKHEDEIDAVFGKALGKKVKKGALPDERDEMLVTGGMKHAGGSSIDNILGAIRSAPGAEKSKKKK